MRSAGSTPWFTKSSQPRPGPGHVLVRVAAAGVGPWDAWIREGRGVLPQPLPLTLGADLTAHGIGPGAVGFRPGDKVFGVTNRRFTGAYAEYALAERDDRGEAGEVHRHRRLRRRSSPAPLSRCCSTMRRARGPDRRHPRAAGMSAVTLSSSPTVGARSSDRVAAGFDLLLSWRGDDRAAGEPIPSHLVAQADVVIDTVGGQRWRRPSPVAATRQLALIVRRQAEVMALADVFLALTVLFLGCVGLAAAMRRPAAAGAGGGGH